ncbi:MAG TPA: carbohydrate ABC transporter permease [Methylomirabilota bacterium]|jgi:multiple sugar transport system permease protein|nr:carbohydrate ABC transporter permease [Methylomirabilota bacterium]
MRSFIITFFAIAIVAAFLSPLVRAATMSVKNSGQISQTKAPLYPADPETFIYHGHAYDVYNVPVDGATRELALVTKGRTESEFVDPAHPDAGLITWEGSWRTLEPVWVFAPQWGNFLEVWDLINYPRLLFNTIALATIGTIGTLLSCTLVAYAFARFRFPAKGFLFTLLIATIFLPAAVTLIPTYTIFYKLGWIGTWLPLLVPAFLANAYDVFLLRQYLLTIPHDLDEAAQIDGAGPFRILVSVVLPQAWPGIIAVGVFSFVYSWNDYFSPLIYLSTAPDLQPISVGLAAFHSIHYRSPALIQAGTLMTLVIPVLIFIVFQRFFTRGIVISGVEK